MPKEQMLQRILDCGVVAVIRASSGEVLADVASALAEGGVHCVEVTFTVPAAHRVLEDLTSRLGGKIFVGAGTVLDSETARVAILSGAEFVVSPTVHLGVIELCRRYDKAVIPGALTPTEVLSAWQAGADIVKIFPSEITGPAYLKALRGPLPQVRLMPTGGVNLLTAADFLKAGACALGVGGALVDAKSIQERDFARITTLARQYMEIVRRTREEMNGGK